MSFFVELKRRNVVKVGIAYAITAWIVLQFTSLVVGPLNLPEWVPALIIVLVSVAFPIILFIAWAFELTPEGIKPSKEVVESESIQNITAQKLNRIVIFGLVIALGFVVIDSYILNETDSSIAEKLSEIPPEIRPVSGEPVPEETVSSVLPNSIAVLPFDNLSIDPDDTYALGLHEEVLNQLVKLGNLNVISRTSVMQYTEDRPTIPEIARALNVETVMEGSVRHAGDRIIVTVQLIDGITDAHIWSESYPGDLSDIATYFSLQADIAMNVANAIGIEFSSEEMESLEIIPTDSPEAYALYLRAWNATTVGGGVSANFEEIDDALAKAIELDPGFALAHAMRALQKSFTLINTTYKSINAQDHKEIQDLVRFHAERAIAIDPNVPYAHTALADMYNYTWYWAEALQEYKKSLEIFPGDLEARRAYSWLLSWNGRNEEAIEQGQRGLELNPGNFTAQVYFAISYANAGNYDLAIELFNKVIQVAPSFSLPHAWLGYIAFLQGDVELAIRELRFSELMEGYNSIGTPQLIYAYSLLNLDDDVQRLYPDIIEQANIGNGVGEGAWVHVYLAIGDHEKALEWLEVIADKAENHEIDQSLFNIMNLKMNYMNDPVLKEPEFVEIFSRIQGN